MSDPDATSQAAAEVIAESSKQPEAESADESGDDATETVEDAEGASEKKKKSRKRKMKDAISGKGKAGDCVVFHANLFHASGVNISPFDRRVAFISYNSVKNLPKPTRPPRPEFLAARNFEPLTPIPDEVFQ